jgi:hypothetical protein
VTHRLVPGLDFCRKFLFLACGVIVIAGPFFYPYVQVKKLFGFSRSLNETVEYSASLTSYFSAPPTNRVWGEITQKFAKTSEGQLHPGVVTLLLAFLGAALSLRNKQASSVQKRTVKFALFMVLVTFLLSLGPRIHFYGHPLFPGPYLLLYKYVPGFDGIRAPARFGPFFMFAATILASYGILEITRRRGKKLFYLFEKGVISEQEFRLKTSRVKRLFPLAVGSLILIEYLSTPLPVPVVPGGGEPLPVYQWLGQQHGVSPVVEVPFEWSTNIEYIYFSIEYVYFSVFHRKDLLNGYSGYAPPSHIYAEQLMKHFPSSVSLDFLENLGVRYAVLHLNKLEPATREATLAALPQFRERIQKVQDFGADQVYELVQTKALTRDEAAHRWSSMPKIFLAEDLPSQIGRLIKDPLTDVGLVRYADRGEAGVITFGPYLSLPSGHYQARFFLRVFPTEGSGAEVGHLDVAADLGTKQLAFYNLDGELSLGQPDYQMISLDFEVKPADHQKNIECRVISTGTAAISVVRIEIWPENSKK